MKPLLPISLLLLIASCTQPVTQAQNDQRGSDCANAISVKTIAEEYQWLKAHYPGCKFLGQSLSQCPKFPVDVLRVKTSDGVEKAVYFDITIVMEEEKKMFNIK